ncbi:mechanosensitive ion channel family protein [Pseudomonas sp. ABC1]|uniref:DUF3772 domain-containing protein n=1 Tax=Pseudomonas sp. ABC1 TaxID=2748080 RepID=UPI0015C2CD3E|nr:DUF3772 domain-containing protein [Pseudomonas sp. ABC1]QLF93255.1 mechanosensitive ion channel family protein [Pseudomonas sp. ABC1]
MISRASRLLRRYLCHCLPLCLLVLSLGAWAQEQDEQAGAQPFDAQAVAAHALVLQERLDQLKQAVSGDTDDARLGELKRQALELGRNARELLDLLQAEQAPLQTQLDVLGPKPDPDALQETEQVSQQRDQLNRQMAALQARNEQVLAVQNGASALVAQIIELRRGLLKTQLAMNNGSLLGTTFWAPLFSPPSEDANLIAGFAQQLRDVLAQAWANWPLSALYLTLALLIGWYGRGLLDRGLAWGCIHWLPLGRLRRSALAFASSLDTFLVAFVAVTLLSLALFRHAAAGSPVAALSDHLIEMTLFSALIAGIGRALLANDRPSWRLPAMDDAVALTLKPFPPLLAGIVLLFGILERTHPTIGAGIRYSTLLSGLSALSIAVVVLAMVLRTNQVRRQLSAAGTAPEARSTLAGLLHMGSGLVAVTILLALLAGYIQLAHFMAYELIWAAIVLSCFYLLSRLCIDAIDALFSPENSGGRLLKQSLNLDDRHLAQAASLLGALCRCVLVLLALVAILNGAFGDTTPLSLLQRFIELLGGDGWGQLDIVPAHIFNALLCLLVGIYVLRTAKRWLERDFLPKTSLDTGIRSSVVTLASNIGYVALILVTLAALGVQWSKLAWIVSALSVGIGFGLQEIVKNFISGLILLTERPVKVGDLVSISGVEGDIRRINVRATEIQLSDRSTVIVPNSQLISQNVRNVTMSGAQGVVSIALTLPLDIDPEQVRDLLLDAFRRQPNMLETPAPSVSFSQLTPTGIVLSTTGYVASPRSVSSTKSALLFDILKDLRAAGINLSSPQRLQIENTSGETDAIL